MSCLSCTIHYKDNNFSLWVLFVAAFTSGVFKTMENLFAVCYTAFGIDTPLLAWWDVFMTGCAAIVTILQR